MNRISKIPLLGLLWIILCVCSAGLLACASPLKDTGVHSSEKCKSIRSQGPDIRASDFLIIAHRGWAAEKPENTLEAFDAALKEGANALEIDVSLTKDSKVVLWHDWNPRGIIARGRELGLEPYMRYRPYFSLCPRVPVNQLSLTELRSRYGYAKKGLIPLRKVPATIPTFEEFVAWARGKPALKYVFLDIKVPEDEADEAKELLRIVKQTFEPILSSIHLVLLTPYDTVMKFMKNHSPELNYSFDMEISGGIVMIPRHFSAVTKALEYNNEFASVGRPTKWTLLPWNTYRETLRIDLALREDYRRYSSKNIKLISWPINEDDQMEELIRAGVQGIITDRPARLKSVLQRVCREQKAPLPKVPDR